MELLARFLFWLGLPFFLCLKWCLSPARWVLGMARKKKEVRAKISRKSTGVNWRARITRWWLQRQLIPKVEWRFSLPQNEWLRFWRWRRAQKKISVPLSSSKVASDVLYDWLPASTWRTFWANWQFEVVWWWSRLRVRKTLVVRKRRPVPKRFAIILPTLPAVPRIPRWVSVTTLVVVAFFASAYGFYDWILKDLPSPKQLAERSPIVSTKIYDRNGELLYKIFKDENRTVVPLSAVSPYLVQATIAVEDSQFYEHWGVSFRGIARAFLHNNSQSQTVQGGSTITQQLVKNTLLSPEKTFRRKIREAILAVAVDVLYTKEEILEGYFNEVNYGGSVYGAEEASQWYFGKSARDLTLGESALLAGLPVAPSVYSPFGAEPERAHQRQHEVLRRMQEVGFITDEQRSEGENEALAFRTGTYEIQAPHFVMFIRELLAERFGEDMVSQGGLEVHTTLDSAVQASAEAALAKELTRLQKLKVGNGAALVTDPKSGEVLAMVGSRNYFDTAHDGQVNIVFRERQPGSSIKPVTYALAFERGYSPASMIDDAPVAYTAQGAPPYAPKNYDGRFHGRVTLRQALGSSYNVPAVRLLAELGVDSLVQKGRDMGITTWNDPRRYGLALTLGAGEVTMYDMARVYGVFANGGWRVDLNPLLSVTTYDGKELYRNPCVDAASPCQAKKALSEMAAYQITSVLSDNAARTPAFGPNSVLNIPNQEVAVKTGTTNSLRDNWTIGYVSDRLVVTWVGNNDNTPMSQVASGVTGASPIWSTIMKDILPTTLAHKFPLPPGYVRVAVCTKTGTLPCSACPSVSQEIFAPGHAPTKECKNEWFAAENLNEDGSMKTASR